jgi:hypothetical protein
LVGGADLLALSRTASRFRSILYGAGATRIWVNARKAAGLPQLKTRDLTELRYASLVWDRHFCHVRLSRGDGGKRAVADRLVVDAVVRHHASVQGRLHHAITSVHHLRKGRVGVAPLRLFRALIPHL